MTDNAPVPSSQGLQELVPEAGTINAQVKRFVDIICQMGKAPNYTKAAVLAGYPQKVADNVAWQLLKRPEVIDAIEKERQRTIEDLPMSLEQLIREFMINSELARNMKRIDISNKSLEHVMSVLQTMCNNESRIPLNAIQNIMSFNVSQNSEENNNNNYISVDEAQLGQAIEHLPKAQFEELGKALNTVGEIINVGQTNPSGQATPDSRPNGKDAGADPFVPITE